MAAILNQEATLAAPSILFWCNWSTRFRRVAVVSNLLYPIAGYMLAYPLFAFITSKLTNADTPIWKIFLAFVLGDVPVFVGGIITFTSGNMGWSQP
ncbi:MAG: biotin transporter BioY [Streptococcus sp.]